MTTAFVLSGGGSLGAVQVGMLQALEERGIRPDLLIGTSAGALNAAYLAGHGMSSGSLEQLAEVWRRLRRQDVFPADPVRLALAVRGTQPSLCSSGAFRRLVADHLPYRRLEDATIPVHLVATDVLSGEEVLLSSGDVVDGALASAAIPAVFPPVEVEGRLLWDGGIADNAAISQALALGADGVYVLPAGVACALDAPPRGALASALHALTLLIEQRLILEVAFLAERAELHVLPPLCPLAVSAVDFRRGAELIDRARRATRSWLASGGTRRPRPERFLSLHHHRGSESDHGCGAGRAGEAGAVA
jgi:NTE family protein